MKKIKKRDLISFACVFCSSLIMAATTKTFVRPAHLLSGGFMGIALLVDMIADLFGKSIPTAFTLVVLNVPVALICAKKISKRFVFFSLLQVFLTSFLLQIIPNYPLFDEQVLNVVFGGYIWGMSIVKRVLLQVVQILLLCILLIKMDEKSGCKFLPLML